MQNHVHKVQVESSDPFPRGDLFPRLFGPSNSHSRGPRAGVGDGLSIATASGSSQRAAQVFEFPECAIPSRSQASERVALAHGWHFCPGDPIDAHDLAFACRQRLHPIAGDFLSPLEDDSAPATRRDGKADDAFGASISRVRPEFVDSGWAMVSLSDPAVMQTNAGQVGWYRRKFESPATDEGRHIGLEVIGGFGRYLVWLNGHCVGRPGSSSTGLRSDLTPHLIFGGTNTLVIRLENCTVSTEGPALSPYVSLVKKKLLHLGQSGSAVSGVIRGGDKAELTISTTLYNEHRNARRGTLCCALLDPAGKALAEAKGDFQIFGQDRSLRQLRLTVDNASWLAENPCEYLIRTRIVLSEEILDEEISPFSIRTALWDHLNDEFLSQIC
jgi:hypothetical protein